MEAGVAANLNKPAQFGVIADDGEREAASREIEKNYLARASGDWARQCATLSARMIKSVQGPTKKTSVRGCAAALKQEAEPLMKTKGIRANTLTGPIDVLRVKGSEGVALYHGVGGKDYALAMKMENGKWKVANLVAIEIP